MWGICKKQRSSLHCSADLEEKIIQKYQIYLMDVIRMFLFVALGHSVSSLELTGSSAHDARLGSDARIPFLITVEKPPVDLHHLTIIWRFLDKEILRYNKTVRTTSPRYSLSPEELTTGIVVLIITNVQISDGGRYKSSVIYGSKRKEKEVWLDIGAPPQVTITDKMVVVNAESVLRCSATGFFPPDIDIEWFINGEKLDKMILGDPWRNPDRTYSVNSSMTITPTEEDRERNFSCRVQHKLLQEPLHTDFRLVYEDRSSAGIIAACSVLVIILIIIIIAAVLWWRRKSGRKVISPFKLEDIMGPPRLIGGEEVALYCRVDNAPEDLTVTWLIRRDGQEQEIHTSQMRGQSEEEESLLDRSYVVKSQREGPQYSSSLSFIPHMERHKDVTFICRGVSGKHKDEKTFHCRKIYGKPQMSAPIEITMADSSHVQFSLNLQKFYLKDIRISWSWEDLSGVYRSITDQTISTRDNDVRYEVTSVVRVPGHIFTVPMRKVTVEWKHKSMWMPETQSLSVRDLPWHPHIGSINVPRLENGKAATLTCDISGYFPHLLSVTWFTKKDGNVTALPRDPSNVDRTYKMSNNEKRQEDYTYSCEASVTFTPIISSDEGSEILCRVQHPSEERPIERSTGPLHIDEKKEIWGNFGESEVPIILTSSSNDQ